MAFRSPERPTPALPAPVRSTEALGQADLSRFRRGLALGTVLCLSTAALFQLATPTTLRWIASTGLVVGAAASLAMRSRMTRRGRVDDVDMAVVGTLLTFVALVALAYIGPFSAGVAVLCLLVFFCGSSNDDLMGLAVYVGSACGYFALTIAALSGAIDPTQSPIATVTTTRGLVLLSLVVQGLLLSAFYVARTNRRLYVEALERMTAARHQARRNEVELVRVRAHAQSDDEAVFGQLSGLSLGRYRLGEVIGRGGMGEVYRALDDDSGQPVAVKVLTESMRDDPDHVERFFREAQVSSELDSPHIVKILDAAWSTDGRYPYLAMELLEGRDLGNHLRQRGPLPLRDVVDLVQDVAEALSCAHAVGIVHRDMKPENVFLAEEAEGARWKVLDFGISKMRDSRGTLTRNAVIGTPNYMSPEQARGGGVDARADIFALGAIVYRVLTGRMAFDAPEPLAALLQVMHDMPVDPTELCAIPRDVELALALALAKDKLQRFACARAFAHAFRAAARSDLDDRLRDEARELLQAHPWTASDVICTKRPAMPPPVIADEAPPPERETSLPQETRTEASTPPPRASHTRTRLPTPRRPPRVGLQPPSQRPIARDRRDAFGEDDTLPLEEFFPDASSTKSASGGG